MVGFAYLSSRSERRVFNLERSGRDFSGSGNIHPDEHLDE